MYGQKTLKFWLTSGPKRTLPDSVKLKLPKILCIIFNIFLLFATLQAYSQSILMELTC